MKSSIQKILILIMSFSLVTFAHERHEEVVPQLDKVLIEQLIGILEKKDFNYDETLEKDALAIDWLVWLFGAFSLDTKKGNQELIQSLKAIDYHSSDDENILFFWERDMRYIVNIIDLIQYHTNKQECKESSLLEECYYFVEIDHNVREEDKKLLKFFLVRINILLKEAKGE